MRDNNSGLNRYGNFKMSANPNDETTERDDRFADSDISESFYGGKDNDSRFSEVSRDLDA